MFWSALLVNYSSRVLNLQSSNEWQAAAERQAVEPSQEAILHLNIHTADGPEVISLVFESPEAKAEWEEQLVKAKELLER